MLLESRETHLPIEQQDVLLGTMTSGDLRMMNEWLGVGTEKFRANEAKTLAEGLMDHKQNADKGLNRGLVLVMGFLIKRTGSWQSPEIQATLMDQLTDKLGGEEKALEVIDEGVEENGDIVKITSRPKTDLGERVMEVVEQWWLSESEQAKLSAAELALDHRQQTINELKNEAERLKEQLETTIGQRDAAVRSQHADGEHIDLLQRQLEKKEASGGETWDDMAREKAGKIYEILPEKVKTHLESVLKKLDPIKDKQVEKQTEVPQDLEAINKTLLERFAKLEEIDLPKLVAASISNEAMGSLAQILRLQLEERRQAQAEVRRKNQEKKEVKDYFTDNELRLIMDGQHTGVDPDLAKKIIKAQNLGVDIDEHTASIEVNDEVLGKVGIGLKIEKGEVDLSAEMDIMALKAGEISDKQVALITLLKRGLDEKITPAGWAIDVKKLLTSRTTELTLTSGQKCSLEIGDTGSLIIKTSITKEEEIVEFRNVIYGFAIAAYHKVKNPLEFLYLEVEGKVAEGEQSLEKPKEKVVEVEALPPGITEAPSSLVDQPFKSESDESQLPDWLGGWSNTLLDLSEGMAQEKAEPPVKTEVAAAAAKLEEVKRPEEALPDWLQALQSVPSQVVGQVPAKTVEVTAAPLPKPEEMPLPPLPQPEEKPVETVIEAAKPAEPPALETKEEEKSQQQRQGLDF